MNITAKSLLAALIAVIIHTVLKYRSLRIDAKKANEKYSFIEFLSDDWTGIILSLLSPLLWFFMFEEAVAKYPLLDSFMVCSFATMGLFGSYILQLIFSRGKKKIRTIIDDKTNELDVLKEK